MKNSEQIALLRAEIEALKVRVASLELRLSPPVYPAPMIPLTPSTPYPVFPWTTYCGTVR